jgi:hypothetical protein
MIDVEKYSRKGVLHSTTYLLYYSPCETAKEICVYLKEMIFHHGKSLVCMFLC